MLRSRDGQRITIISHENYAGFLADLIERLPDEGELSVRKFFLPETNVFDRYFRLQIEPESTGKDPVGNARKYNRKSLKKVIDLTKCQRAFHRRLYRQLSSWQSDS